MTSAEKTELYSFLCFAEDWISGYSKKRTFPKFSENKSTNNVILLFVESVSFDVTEAQLIDKMLSAIEVSVQDQCIILQTDQTNQKINEFLENAILEYKPKTILCMGSVFCTKDLKLPSTLEECQEKIFTISDIPTIITYSPNQILTEQQYKRPVWENLKILKSLYYSL